MPRQFLENERPLRTTREHWVVFLPVATFSVAVAVLAVVFLLLVPESVAGHASRNAKIIVVLGALVVLMGAILTRYMQWRYTYYMLTDRRIMIARGVISRYTESISLDRVQDSSVRQTFVGRLVRAGDLEIETAGHDGTEILYRIYDPVGFSAELLHAIEAHRMNQVFGGMPPVPTDGPGVSGYSAYGGYAPPQPGYGPTPSTGYGPPLGYGGPPGAPGTPPHGQGQGGR